jgi:hypothetical protein
MDGGKVTGALITTPIPPPTTTNEITDVKIDGNNITFSISRPGRGGGDPIVIPYKGTISGNTITGTMTQPGFGGGDPMDIPWTATKH